MRIDDGGGKPHNAEYDDQAFGSAFKDGGVFDRGRSTLQRGAISQAQNIMIMTMRSRYAERAVI